MSAVVIFFFLSYVGDQVILLDAFDFEGEDLRSRLSLLLLFLDLDEWRWLCFLLLLLLLDLSSSLLELPLLESYLECARLRSSLEWFLLRLGLSGYWYFSLYWSYLEDDVFVLLLVAKCDVDDAVGGVLLLSLLPEFFLVCSLVFWSSSPLELLKRSLKSSSSLCIG